MIRTRKERTKLFRKQIEHEWTDRFLKFIEDNPDKPWDYTYLSQHPKVDKTIYPGLENHPQYSLAKKQMLEAGSIVTFIIKGTDTFKFMNALNLFDISNNLGDTKSLVTHPATTTHRVIGEEGRKKLNIPDNMIRLSIGLEDVEDLIEDIDQALKQINN